MAQSRYDYTHASQDYQRIGQALHYLKENFSQQPQLKEIAESVHLSEYHFQRLFTRWVGVSPKTFLQHLTKEYAQALLEESGNLLDTAYLSGLSSLGRLHDLFVSCEAVTPGEVKRRGEGLEIAYGFHPTPFGECLLAVTSRGVCHLAFVDGGGKDLALTGLCKRWPRARLRHDPAQTRSHVAGVFHFFDGKPAAPLQLFLSGSSFQIKVWEALLRIPPGTVVTYQDIAVSIGLPGASRAVGQAIGQNPLPVIIPCHRVIRSLGGFGGYRYGVERKQALLGWEFCRYSRERVPDVPTAVQAAG